MIDSTFTKTAGQVNWIPQEGDTYLVTGVDVRNRRFTYSSNRWTLAQGLNVYRGSKWLIRDGKRHLIQRVYN